MRRPGLDAKRNQKLVLKFRGLLPDGILKNSTTQKSKTQLTYFQKIYLIWMNILVGAPIRSAPPASDAGAKKRSTATMGTVSVCMANL
jgi:hypothetical protein